MKLKFLFFILLTSILNIDSVAQITTFNWSEVVGKSTNQKFEKALVDDQKNIHIIKTKEGEKGIIYLDIIDSLGRLKFNGPITLACDRLEKYAMIRNKLCVFATSYNVTENQDALSVYQINNNGNLISTVPLMKIEANGGYHCLFSPTVSSNEKFVSIVCTHPFKENRSEKLTINLYNNDFKELKSTNLPTSIAGKKRRVTVSTVNDNGFTYVIKKHRTKSKTSYDLYTFDATGSHHHNHLNVKTKKIADMKFKVNQNGALIVAGFYSALNKRNFEGIFAMEFGESVYPTWTKSYLLNENVVTTFKSKKEISSNGYGLDRFHTKDIHITKAGDILLSAEHHGIIQDKKLGTLDHRLGLILVRLNKTGGMKGVTAIVTDQQDAQNAGYFSSHSLIVGADSTMIFYNKMGETDSKVKAFKSEGAFVHITQNSISESMTNTVSYPQFNPSFNSYLLQPQIYLSNATVQLILIESLDTQKYKIGFIHSNSTEK